MTSRVRQASGIRLYWFNNEIQGETIEAGMAFLDVIKDVGNNFYGTCAMYRDPQGLAELQTKAVMCFDNGNLWSKLLEDKIPVNRRIFPSVKDVQDLTKCFLQVFFPQWRHPLQHETRRLARRAASNFMSYS
ncbi:hypothetical protein PTKIN_Ptkin15bG0035700 [Pterospermum kingtungense]